MNIVNETVGFKRPINQPKAIYGHFGKPNFPREALDYPKIQRMLVFIGLNLVSL
jgi:S-adenosylmethionine synthetase